MKTQLVTTVDLDGAKDKFVAVEVRYNNKNKCTLIVDDKSVRYCKPGQNRKSGVSYSIDEFISLMKKGKKI